MLHQDRISPPPKAWLQLVLLQDALCAQPPGWTTHPQNSHEPSAQEKGRTLGPAVSQVCSQARRLWNYLNLRCRTCDHLLSAEGAEAARDGEHAQGRPQ